MYYVSVNNAFASNLQISKLLGGLKADCQITFTSQELAENGC